MFIVYGKSFPQRIGAPRKSSTGAVRNFEKMHPDEPNYTVYKCDIVGEEEEIHLREKIYDS